MNYNRLQTIYRKYAMKILPVKVGQLLEIHEEVGEEGNKKNWKFRALVIKKRKDGHPDGTFMVRGESNGVIIEKIYPLSYTKFNKLLLIDEYKTRKAKLYYLRHKIGKGARMKSIISSNKRGVDLLKSV